MNSYACVVNMFLDSATDVKTEKLGYNKLRIIRKGKETKMETQPMEQEKAFANGSSEPRRN